MSITGQNNARKTGHGAQFSALEEIGIVSPNFPISRECADVAEFRSMALSLLMSPIFSHKALLTLGRCLL